MSIVLALIIFFFFQAEDGIRDLTVTGVQTCALPISYPGGTAPSSALCWNKGQQPEITVDLGVPQKCGAFRIQLGAGWPWWDALKGEFKDKVEVLTSPDGQNYSSRGYFNLNLRWKDLPANHIW